MSANLVNQLRRRTLPTDMGGLTVYDEDPMCIEAADRIEQLEAALREITSVSKVYVTKGEDMAQALVTLLASHRKIALAALEGKDD